MLAHPSFFETEQSLGIPTLMSGFGGDEVTTSFADVAAIDARRSGLCGDAGRLVFGAIHVVGRTDSPDHLAVANTAVDDLAGPSICPVTRLTE
jgi:hypothetical protein